MPVCIYLSIIESLRVVINVALISIHSLAYSIVICLFVVCGEPFMSTRHKYSFPHPIKSPNLAVALFMRPGLATPGSKQCMYFS